MRKDQPIETAVGQWEAEGGGVHAASEEPAGLAYAACFPSLPAGYEAQPAWGFEDGSARCVYSFNRVYGPARPLRGDGSVLAGRLDEDLSYWEVSWPMVDRSGAERPAACWLTFGEARRRQGSRLTFARFSSAKYMRANVAALRG